MKQYRERRSDEAVLVGASDGIIDPAVLFGRRAPLRLEIGFGHGEFLSQMASVHPEEDFIGVERIDIRVTKTARKSRALATANIRLFQDDAGRFVARRLPPACIHRCYILFSDPWPKRRHRRRRVVNRQFLIDLARIMSPGGRLRFASDCHEYAMQVLSHLSTVGDLWRNADAQTAYRFDLPTRFPTVFERHRKAEGHTICYLNVDRI